MPAWAAIRAYLDSGSRAHSGPGPLLFWTPAGPVTVTATLEAISRGEQPLVRVTLQSDLAHSTAEPPAEPPAPTMAATAGTPRPPPLDFKQHADPALRDGAAAKLAHELRTPLSAIVSLAEIMRDERLGAMGNPRYKAYAADIHDTARHTLDLIGAMLDVDRDEANATGRAAHPRLELDNVDLNDIAKRCASAMQPIAARGGVAIALAPSDDVKAVHADRRAIRQIILNVLSNALRFTPTGGRITLATARRNDGTVELSVADTGSGMDPADIARVLAGTTTAAAPPRTRLAGEHAGFGFGLPLVRELAEAHGGSLDIESVPEHGTRVVVTLPAAGVPPP